MVDAWPEGKVVLQVIQELHPGIVVVNEGQCSLDISRDVLVGRTHDNVDVFLIVLVVQHIDVLVKLEEPFFSFFVVQLRNFPLAINGNVNGSGR